MKAPYPNPYYPLPEMTLLRDSHATLTPERAEALKEYIALTAPDRHAAALYIDLDGDDWMHIYPPQQKEEVSTDRAIDTFLNLYGGGEDEKETALLERLIFNPTPDYATVLAQGEKPVKATDAQDRMIDAFLGRQSQEKAADVQKPEKTAPAKPLPEKKPDANQTLSENLARVFIRQKRYRQALDILRDLGNTNPERAALYTSHIRFLEKVVALTGAN